MQLNWYGRMTSRIRNTVHCGMIRSLDPCWKVVCVKNMRKIVSRGAFKDAQMICKCKLYRNDYKINNSTLDLVKINISI